MRQRMRIRFRKAGDLRLISHRDLARLWERMFRRAQLPLAMSEGFHPKARLSFPSALALGIEGWDEVLEVELSEAVAATEVQQRLAAEAPPGLQLTQAEWLAPGTPKAQILRATYEIAIPPERTAQVAQAVAELLSRDAHWMTRPGRDAPVEIRSGIEHLELAADRLRMILRHSHEASVRPRDILSALNLSDLETSGPPLARTRVELAH